MCYLGHHPLPKHSCLTWTSLLLSSMNTIASRKTTPTSTAQFRPSTWIPLGFKQLRTLTRTTQMAITTLGATSLLASVMMHHWVLTICVSAILRTLPNATTLCFCPPMIWGGTNGSDIQTYLILMECLAWHISQTTSIWTRSGSTWLHKAMKLPWLSRCSQQRPITAGSPIRLTAPTLPTLWWLVITTEPSTLERTLQTVHWRSLLRLTTSGSLIRHSSGVSLTQRTEATSPSPTLKWLIQPTISYSFNQATQAWVLPKPSGSTWQVNWTTWAGTFGTAITRKAGSALRPSGVRLLTGTNTQATTTQTTTSSSTSQRTRPHTQDYRSSVWCGMDRTRANPNVNCWSTKQKHQTSTAPRLL